MEDPAMRDLSTCDACPVHDRTGDPEAAVVLPPPELATGAPSPRGAGADLLTLAHHLTGHGGDSAAVHTPETTHEFPLLK